MKKTRDIHRQLGASNHSDVERQNEDYYATDPEAVNLFLDELIADHAELPHSYWECAVGGASQERTRESRV